jgi:hypothetical protein
MTKLVDSIKGCSDKIFEIRDKLGAALRPVYVVTRTWTGRAPGEGTMTEVVQELTPVPGIRDIAHDRLVKEGGTATEGDLIVYHISKRKYAESDINCKSAAKNVVKLFKIGTEFYRVIHVHERYVSWDVHVRRLTDQRGTQS